MYMNKILSNFGTVMYEIKEDFGPLLGFLQQLNFPTVTEFVCRFFGRMS